MAWSWSHTEKAYDYAERQVREILDRERLDEAAACWAATTFPEGDSWDTAFDIAVYEKEKPRYAAMPRAEVAEYVWDRMCEAATCDNGGWNAWVDPEGFITVPFGPPEGEEEDVPVVPGEVRVFTIT